MKKIFTLVVAAMTAICAFAQDYTHSAGLVVGNLNGLSYKYFLSEELAIQADLGFGIVATSGSFVSQEKFSQKDDEYDNSSKLTLGASANLWTFELAPNFIWQKNITSFDWASLDFFVGGGVSIGYAKLTRLEAKKAKYSGKETYRGEVTERNREYNGDEIRYMNIWGFADYYAKSYGKFGVNAIGGVELALTGAPITIGLDFRPGYGLMFTSDLTADNKELQEDIKNAGEDASIKESDTYSFFDWTLAATVRYTF